MLVSYTKADVPRRETRDRPTDHNRRDNDRGTEGVTFAEANTQGQVQCYNCQEMGHYATACTNPSRTRQQGNAAPAVTTGTTFLMATTSNVEEEDNKEIVFSFNMTDKASALSRRNN